MTNLRDLFPNTRHLKSSREQLDKVIDELVEVEVELQQGNRGLFLMEAVDVIHAACGVLYKSEFNYTDTEIMETIRAVQDKNRARGYYTT